VIEKTGRRWMRAIRRSSIAFARWSSALWIALLLAEAASSASRSVITCPFDRAGTHMHARIVSHHANFSVVRRVMCGTE
jgi:hypothetical protein